MNDLLIRISDEFSLVHAEQDWGIENGGNISLGKALGILEAYLGKDAYVDRELIDLAFESANDSLLENSISQAEMERFCAMVRSDAFKGKYLNALNYWSRLDPYEFPVVMLIRN